MIRLHPIKSQASPYWDSLVRSYHTSFPIDEQRPIASIAHLIEHDERFVAYALTDEKGAFIGLLTTWHFEAFIYIEHFAIAPTLRSQGYGSETLKIFIQEHGKPIILEAEPPTDAFSIRRIKFYERLGFTLYNFSHIQPAYTPESNPVELRLMGTLDTKATPLTLVSETLHREVYRIRS